MQRIFGAGAVGFFGFGFLGHAVKATVCIPWRETPDRLAAFERVMEFWSYVGWPVVFGDSPGPFSLAQARNDAVDKARTEVVVISDADTIPDYGNVLRAVADPSAITWPFTVYRRIACGWEKKSDLMAAPVVDSWENGLGGCIVATKQMYWYLGGTPPEFVSWGFEDTSFYAVAATLGRATRTPGIVFSFDHNGGWADRGSQANRDMFMPYHRAFKRPWVMKELLRRRAENPNDPAARHWS